jgi:hypothetical protein
MIDDLLPHRCQPQASSARVSSTAAVSRSLWVGFVLTPKGVLALKLVPRLRHYDVVANDQIDQIEVAAPI